MIWEIQHRRLFYGRNGNKTDLDPAALKGKQTRAEQRQIERDAEGIDLITDALERGPATTREILRRTGGMGKARAERLLDRLEASQKAIRRPVTVKGNATYEYALIAEIG